MLQDSIARLPMAVWNSARGVWETTDQMLFCAHQGLFAEAWPISGMTRAGLLWPLPGSVRHTIAVVFSSSQNPQPDGEGASLLPTPRCQPEAVSSPGFRPNLGTVVKFLPTPQSFDSYLDGMSAEHAEGRAAGETSDHQVMLPVLAKAGKLLPTPLASDSHRATPLRRYRDGEVVVQSVANVLGEWLREDGVVDQDDYTPALERWALVLGREVPPPTVQHPTRPDGNHLNPVFVEWMMGLEEGWVTGVPNVSRSGQLKMLGNGVVPQQAAAILQILDEGW